MAIFKFDNPFIHNYVFTDDDIERMPIDKLSYPLLFLLPTYVQITNNYAIFYKQFMNKYFIMGYEKWLH